MINIARIPSGMIFLTLAILTILVQVQWKFAAVVFPLMLGWYVLMRANLSESKSYLRNPVYVFAAIFSFLYVPIIAVAGMVFGDSELERISKQSSPYLIPLAIVFPSFYVYSVWTAARELIVAEGGTAADRAVRWERTWKPFLQLFFWPVGVWSIHKRFQKISE